MKCCENCFKDSLLKRMIIEYGSIGDCDFCSSKDVKTYDISNQNELADKIVELIQTYEVSLCKEAKPIKVALHDDWDIFNGGTEAIRTLILALCAPYPGLDASNDRFNENVIIPQAYDKDYVNDYGVVKGQTWKQFSDAIKYGNRFHNKLFNGDALSSFLSVAKMEIDPTEKLYRARIAPSISGFKVKEMGAPPKELRKQGRANPDGIGVLYLASDEQTALNEVRANVYDYVSIGTFKARKKLSVVNLSAISKLSPFSFGELAAFYINREVFREIASEIAKPQRRSDSQLEYLPTQFISEFVKAQGFDGVAYDSTMRSSGYNLAVYDENSFKCVSVKTIEVTYVEYRHKNLKKPGA